MPRIRVGMISNAELDTRVVERMRRVTHAAMDHVGTIDHVSFQGGRGVDGLVTAAALAVLGPRLAVYVGVYLLPLRHPMAVARQLATLARLAPGRLVFGVGIGGEDRAEVANCGVDPRTRGRRMDESLSLLRRLLGGEEVTHRGEFFRLEGARIEPAPDPPIPIVVGGHSDAAVRRAARLGDGWIGVFNSARRFRRAVAGVAEEAARHGREGVRWQHAMELWCGFGPDVELARQRLGPVMERFYALPFGPFERYAPCGRPEHVAGFLADYVDAGCTTFNLIAVGGDFDEAVEGVAEVRKLLNG